MAKRIVCCPVAGASDTQKFEYLYIDTSKLLVKNVTGELSELLGDVKGNCCFDVLSDYVLGEKILDEKQKKSLSFKLGEINSFELFKSVDELRFKTGSEKILHSCLLNYYRREYDETQQYSFFSEPGVSNTYVSIHDGVEHEISLEDRVWIKKEKEEVELETLDKGKSDAEREAEAEQAQAELAMAEAQAEAEAAALKKEKKDAKRKKFNRLMEEERYREFRNQDDVKNAQYKQLREYEEEMRRNNDVLAAEYDDGNYNSLPGWVPEDSYSAQYESADKDTIGLPVNNFDLYGLASRMDEFGVPYTVVSESFADGTKHSVLCYSSDYADTGELARDFYELEQALLSDNVVDKNVFYSAFQLSALDYAYANNVDIFYVRNGEFNGNQMYRVIDAGLNGYDMAVVANPSYTPEHMDALTHYMSFGWNTNQISDPMISPTVLADSIMQEERAQGISKEYAFFEKYDYSEFLSYNENRYVSMYSDDFDAKAQDYYRKNAQQIREADFAATFEAFKESLHEGYEARQREMNYLPREDSVPSDNYSDVEVPSSDTFIDSRYDDNKHVSENIREALSDVNKGEDFKISSPELSVRDVHLGANTGFDKPSDVGFSVDKHYETGFLGLSNEVAHSLFGSDNTHANPGEFGGSKVSSVGDYKPEGLKNPAGSSNEVRSAKELFEKLDGARKQVISNDKQTPGVTGDLKRLGSDGSVEHGSRGIPFSKENNVGDKTVQNEPLKRGARLQEGVIKGRQLSNDTHPSDNKATKPSGVLPSIHDGKQIGKVSTVLGGLNELGRVQPGSSPGLQGVRNVGNKKDVSVSHNASKKDVLVRYVDPITHEIKTIPSSRVTPELRSRCSVFWKGVNDGSIKLPNKLSQQISEIVGQKGQKNIPDVIKKQVVTSDVKKSSKENETVHLKKSSDVGGAGGGGVGGAGGKKTPTQTPTGGSPCFRKNYPLNDLKIRSDFARKMGLRVQNLGSSFFSSSTRYVRRSLSSAVHKITQNDETGTVQAYNQLTRTGGTALYSAGLILDVPRQFMRVGQGISYAGNAIANVGRKHVGATPVEKTFTPLSKKAINKEITNVRNAQVEEIKKKFGVNAVKMNVREINIQIKKLNSDIVSLTRKQSVLRKEIDSLYKKKRTVGLTKAEKLILKDKLKLFNENNELLRKNKLKIKKLSDLKALKEAHCKNLRLPTAKQKGLIKKDGRWTRLPGRLAQSFVSQLNKAGNELTMGGLAQASSYAMSIARNPIVRLTYSLGNNLIIKPVAKVVKKTTNTFVVKPVSKAVKKSTAYKNHLRRKNSKIAKRQKTIKKVKVAVNKTAEKVVGKKTINTVKKGSKKIKKFGETVAKPFKAVGKAFEKVSAFFSGLKAAILKYLLIALGAILGLILIIVLLSAMAQAASSFILAGDESSDGRINLTYYVNKIEDCQDDLQDEINAIATQESSKGHQYDNVFYDYNGPSEGNNTKQILSMGYVRFGLEIDKHKDDVVAYMEQLYKDSNYVDYAESAPYECDNGCEEREYKCYDVPDKFASETRKTQYLASNHGVNGKGCVKSAAYSCMEKGHDTYNKYGCSRHYSGLPMTSKGSCTNYTTRVIPTVQSDGSFKNVTYYYCQGHCNKTHYDYSCPGHKEKICRGEHVDVTITITSLDFDEIFAADSSVATTGSTVRGDAYEDKFTITGYCPCVACCGKSDGITASGVKATANHTIAVDKSVIPLGTHVWIDGREYVAEDTGGAIKGNRIDMYFDSHAEALRWGVRTKTIYKSKPVEEGIDASKDEYGFTGWSGDNLEIVKNVYNGLIAEDADEVYEGLDGVSDLSYGAGEPIDFDFSSIEFKDGELTTRQQKVLAVIESNTVETKAGYCQAWVARVYQAALGGAVQSRCCANHAGEAWGASNDWSSIQVGASVYGYGSSKYGHVGIYIGNGMVAHNIGYVKVQSLESWVKTYNGQCWGWNGGVNLTGKSQYNCKPAGYFMHGKD